VGHVTTIWLAHISVKSDRFFMKCTPDIVCGCGPHLPWRRSALSECSTAMSVQCALTIWRY